MSAKTMRHRLLWVMQGLLGSLLWSSAVLKAGFSRAMVDDLRFRHPWFPVTFAEELSWMVISIEFILGSWLISGWQFRRACQAAIGLLLAFLLFHCADIAFGVVTYCPCFGALIRFTPIGMAVSNLVLILIFAYVPRLTSQESHENARRLWPFPFVLLLGLAFSFWVARDSRFDPLLLRLKPGQILQYLPSSLPVKNLDKRRIVVILDTLDEIPTALQACTAFTGYQPVFLIVQPSDDLDSFFRQPHMTLPLRSDFAAFFYRTTPTAFTIDNERVTRVWYGVLPSPKP